MFLVSKRIYAYFNLLQFQESKECIIFFNLTKVQYRIKLKLKDEYFFFKFLLLSVQQEIISGFPLHLLCIGYACTLYVLSGAGDTS